MANDVGKITKILFVAVVALVLAVFISNFYTFYLQRDYSFTVEASCAPGQNCFIRSCDNPDDCPPNGFEQYRTFSVSASDFDKCLDNSCLNECTLGIISCEETFCDESGGDTCTITSIPE